MTPFAQMLRRQREHARRNKADLARACKKIAPLVRGISESSIRFWETGHQNRRPSLAQLDVLAEALGLTPEEKLEALALARADAPSGDSGPSPPIEDPEAANRAA